MKKIILLFSLLLTASAAMAATPRTADAASADEPQRLVIWLMNGTKVYHDLTDMPETTFENGTLFLRTDKVSISYPLEQVMRYTYEGPRPVVGIQTVKAGEVRFSQSQDGMKFEGLPAGTLLQLYAPDGKLLSTQTAYEGLPAEVSLKNMPTGTYIVKAGDASYKFLKK